MPWDEELLCADPAHHESAFFIVKNFGNSVSYSESENAPVKNFYRANYETIIDLLDCEWDRILEPGDINESVGVFYNKLNQVVEQNVPNHTSFSSHYRPWLDLELKTLPSEKKKLHAIWKDSLRFLFPTQALDYREFQRVRAKCLRLSHSRYLE